MFNALLVELGYFEKITVGFLIVGHTHASIDQYFSCLRKLIRRASFIASPLALKHLFSLDKNVSESAKSRLRSQYRPPLRQVQITFIRDYTAALAPYKSKLIKHFGIPYQWQFFMHLGKCICQYMQFTTSPEWLPPIADYIMPQSTTSSVVQNSVDSQFESLFDRRIYDIEDNYSLASVDGRRAFQQHLGLPENISASDLSINMGNILDIAGSLQKALPILKKLEERGLTELELRHYDEAEGYDDRERYLSESDSEDDEEETTAGNLDGNNDCRKQQHATHQQHHDALRSNQKALESLNTKTKGLVHLLLIFNRLLSVTFSI